MLFIARKDLGQYMAAGDIAPDLPLVRVESELPSALFLARRGVHSESSIFAPRVTVDDLSLVAAGEVVTLLSLQSTAEGTALVEVRAISLEGTVASITPISTPDIDPNPYGLVFDPLGLPGDQYVSPEELAFREALREASQVVSETVETQAPRDDTTAAPPQGSTVEEHQIGDTMFDTYYDPISETFTQAMYVWNGVDWVPIV